MQRNEHLLSESGSLVKLETCEAHFTNAYIKHLDARCQPYYMEKVTELPPRDSSMLYRRDFHVFMH